MVAKKFTRAVLGGTFDRLHVGHEALLSAAFQQAEEVGIGLTTDQFLRSSGSLAKKGSVRSFDERRAELQGFLDAAFPGRAWYLIPLVDRWGAALEPEVRALVVSDETREVGELANRLRRKQRIRPLSLILCHSLLGEDLLRVSSTRIRQGRIDREGRRLTPIRVGVGSENHVKRAGVETALHQVFPDLPLAVEPVRPGRANPQPWGLEEGVQGAVRRATLALGKDRDYGVGVEATALSLRSGGPVLDVHAIAVLGADGTQEVSLSTSYAIPEPLLRRMTGRDTLEEAVQRAGGPKEAGHSRGGALGYLTALQVTRENVIAEGVLCAFVTRLAHRQGRLPPVELLEPARSKSRAPRKV